MKKLLLLCIIPLLTFGQKKYQKNNHVYINTEKTRKNLLNNDFMISRPMHQDLRYLKVVLGNPHTKSKHLNKMADLLNTSV